MKIIKIEKVEDLIFQLNSLPNHFIYRGHADSSWKLESTIERTLGHKWATHTASKFEKYSIDKFKSKYHIYKQSEHIPSSKLSWLSVMQHYGVPTRLLDFTESPYIALYFALEAYDPGGGHDLGVFAIDYSAVMQSSVEFIRKQDSKFIETTQSINGKQDEVFEGTVDRFSYNILWVTEPNELNARIDRQSGTFLISGNTDKKIEELISSETYKNVQFIKYEISSKLYESLFALLRKMSINSKTIYGDLAGLAGSIKMEMQVYSI